MKMFKKVLAGFVATAMVAAMVGCGGSNGGAEADTEAPAEAATEAAATEVLNANADNKLIYCITPSTSNPYFGTVQTA